MHSNADISYQRSVSDKYCNIIMLTLNDEGGDDEGGSDTEKIVNDIISKYLDSLPETLSRNEASKSVKERGNDGMISIFTT